MSISFSLQQGTAGLGSGGPNLALVAGVCSQGTVGQAYLVGQGFEFSQLGEGPLVTALQDTLGVMKNPGTLIAVPLSGSGASVGTIVQNGEGPTITTAGVPKRRAEIVFKIIQAGGRNVGTYQLSLDGGDNYEEETTIPLNGKILLGDTGVELSWPDSDALENEEYRFALHPPTPSIANVMQAIAPHLEKYLVRVIYVVGASDAVDWAVMGSIQDQTMALRRPALILMETRLPNQDESLADFRNSLESEREKYSHDFVQVCAQYGEVTHPTNGSRIVRNWAPLLLGRYHNIQPQHHIGDGADPGITQASLPQGWIQSYSDALKDAGFVVATPKIGLRSPYWNDDPTLADSSSDYRCARVAFIIFEALQRLFVVAQRFENSEVGDPLSPEGAQGIISFQSALERALYPMINANPNPVITAASISIPEGQDITQNGFYANIILIPTDVLKKIQIGLGFAFAGSTYDPRQVNI